MTHDRRETVAESRLTRAALALLLALACVACNAELRVFGPQAQTAPGHSEFIGTGGSLYYLRHASILSGSDQVVLEIRDRTSGRVEQRVPMVRGADYEIDALQGRILLPRPLAQHQHNYVYPLGDLTSVAIVK